MNNEVKKVQFVKTGVVSALSVVVLAGCKLLQCREVLRSKLKAIDINLLRTLKRLKKYLVT